ncbi:MAG TPA: TIM-barrel domain-containing protein [Balneolales bacterium]|nr:TIM-barrel domain-containing protein [Balneolales bacterium]
MIQKIHQILLMGVVMSLAFLISCQSSSYKKVSDGIVVSLHKTNTSAPSKIKLQVVGNKIIHVTATPTDQFHHETNLMLTKNYRKQVNWNVTRQNNDVILRTDSLQAAVSMNTGRVTFRNAQGKVILQEASDGGSSFTPTKVDSQSFYHIRQVFDSPQNEAFYGLGEHQKRFVNLKGHDVTLAQHNTEAAVPFLVSSRNYGILWDNYSITRFGDPNPYKEPSATGLTLYNGKGQPGGLTAKYMEKSDTNHVYHQRTEKQIDYQFLSKLKSFPKGFEGKEMNNSIVEWRGAMESQYGGKHKFALTSAGFVKIWIDGKLRVDRWRQAWNPVTSKIDVQMKKGQKVPIRIKWIPDGGQSFISLKWRKPMPKLDNHELSLYSQVAKQLNYFFVYGHNMDDVIGGYRQLTGKQPIMPKWAMGFWQSREHYDSQKQILSVARKFRKLNIPVDNIVQDWFYWKKNKWGNQRFDPKRYPHPKQMIQDLHSDHFHYMISVWPKFYKDTKAFKRFWSNGWLYKKNVEDQQKDWVGYVSTFYDAFNPHARKAFWNMVDNRLFKLGVNAWWLDASEPDIYSNTTIQKRKELMNPTYLGPSAEYFNAYPLVDAEAFYKGQRQAKPNQRVFILTRSAYAGLQRYSASIWSGDIGTTWLDMKNQIGVGLNYSISGNPFWTMDIGGFAVESRYIHPNKKNLKEWRELQDRWYQFGAFCPLFRAHGQFPYREVFNIAPPDSRTYNSIVKYDKLRYRLMPYIYTLDGMTYWDNYTIMRALPMDFPNDQNVRDIRDEYMFGPDLLINPVTTYKARSRKVYLPKTAGWYNLNTDAFYKGGQTINAKAPYDRIPVYVKAGSILPFGPAEQYTGQKPSNPITLYVYTGQNGHFNLYEDDGVSYDYQKGQHVTIPMTYNDQTQTLTIGKREGSFPDMIKNRTFNIVWISKEHPQLLNFNVKPDKVVHYNGSKVSIQMK